jgi:hypothetical protein
LLKDIIKISLEVRIGYLFFTSSMQYLKEAVHSMKMLMQYLKEAVHSMKMTMQYLTMHIGKSKKGEKSNFHS